MRKRIGKTISYGSAYIALAAAFQLGRFTLGLPSNIMLAHFNAFVLLYFWERASDDKR